MGLSGVSLLWCLLFAEAELNKGRGRPEDLVPW